MTTGDEDTAEMLLRAWARHHVDAAPEVTLPPRPEHRLASSGQARSGADVEFDISPLGHANRRLGAQGRLGLTLAGVLVIALTVGAVLFATHRGHSAPATQPAAISPLYNATWIDVASRATVVFRAGSAHTADGCAGTTVALTVTGNHLQLGKPLGPAYTCGGPPVLVPGDPGYPQFKRQQDAVARFYQVLDASPAWSVRGQLLTLTAPDGRSIRLTSANTAPLTLPGSSWTLDGVVTRGRGNGLALDVPRNAALTFDSNGRFHATDLCNDLSGKVAVSADKVAFSDVTTTKRECSNPNLKTAAATIDALLSRTLTYRIENNTLRLTEHGTDGELIYGPGHRR